MRFAEPKFVENYRGVAIFRHRGKYGAGPDGEVTSLREYRRMIDAHKNAQHDAFERDLLQNPADKFWSGLSADERRHARNCFGRDDSGVFANVAEYAFAHHQATTEHDYEIAQENANA